MLFAWQSTYSSVEVLMLGRSVLQQTLFLKILDSDVCLFKHRFRTDSSRKRRAAVREGVNRR